MSPASAEGNERETQRRPDPMPQWSAQACSDTASSEIVLREHVCTVLRAADHLPLPSARISALLLSRRLCAVSGFACGRCVVASPLDRVDAAGSIVRVCVSCCDSLHSLLSAIAARPQRTAATGAARGAGIDSRRPANEAGQGEDGQHSEAAQHAHKHERGLQSDAACSRATTGPQRQQTIGVDLFPTINCDIVLTSQSNSILMLCRRFSKSGFCCGDLGLVLALHSVICALEVRAAPSSSRGDGCALCAAPFAVAEEQCPVQPFPFTSLAVASRRAPCVLLSLVSHFCCLLLSSRSPSRAHHALLLVVAADRCAGGVPGCRLDDGGRAGYGHWSAAHITQREG